MIWRYRWAPLSTALEGNLTDPSQIGVVLPSVRAYDAAIRMRAFGELPPDDGDGRLVPSRRRQSPLWDCSMWATRSSASQTAAGSLRGSSCSSAKSIQSVDEESTRRLAAAELFGVDFWAKALRTKAVGETRPPTRLADRGAAAAVAARDAAGRTATRSPLTPPSLRMRPSKQGLRKASGRPHGARPASLARRGRGARLRPRGTPARSSSSTPSTLSIGRVPMMRVTISRSWKSCRR